MSQVKIQTNVTHRFGVDVSTFVGTISVNEQGEAFVSTEQAEELMKEGGCGFFIPGEKLSTSSETLSTQDEQDIIQRISKMNKEALVETAIALEFPREEWQTFNKSDLKTYLLDKLEEVHEEKIEDEDVDNTNEVN